MLTHTLKYDMTQPWTNAITDDLGVRVTKSKLINKNNYWGHNQQLRTSSREHGSKKKRKSKGSKKKSKKKKSKKKKTRHFGNNKGAGWHLLS